MTKIREVYADADQLRIFLDELRNAQEDGVCYFRRSDTFELTEGMFIGNLHGYHITLDASQAPGPVEIVGDTPRIDQSNVTVRGITSRDPFNHANLDNADAFGIGTTNVIENVLIENCAFMHAIDGNFDLFFSGAGRGNDIEIRRCIFAECFADAGHSGGRHSTNLLVSPNDPGGGRMRIHDNLFASSDGRSPAIQGGGQGYVYNNLLFNTSSGIEFRKDELDNPTVGAAVANHFIPGVNCEFTGTPGSTTRPPRLRMGQIWGLQPGSQVFIKGNLCDTREGGYDLFDDWLFYPGEEQKGFLTNAWPLDFGSPDDADAVETVYENVLANAGPVNRKGDSITRHPHVERVLREVRNGTSRVPKDRSQIPAMVLPSMLSGKSLYPRTATGAVDPRSISGMTDLEMYLAETRLGLY